jgi:hypothetical protein
MAASAPPRLSMRERFLILCDMDEFRLPIIVVVAVLLLSELFRLLINPEWNTLPILQLGLLYAPHKILYNFWRRGFTLDTVTEQAVKKKTQ